MSNCKRWAQREAKVGTRREKDDNNNNRGASNLVAGGDEHRHLRLGKDAIEARGPDVVEDGNSHQPESKK